MTKIASPTPEDIYTAWVATCSYCRDTIVRDKFSTSHNDMVAHVNSEYWVTIDGELHCNSCRLDRLEASL